MIDRAAFTDTLLLACVATLGWREDPPGSNWSPAIKDWLEAVGYHAPAPWCVAWTHGMYDAAAEVHDVKNPHPRTAGSQRLWAITPARCHRSTPIRGSVVVFAHVDEDGNRDGRGHCGIVAEILPGFNVRTIEGNSGPDGQRNGDSVVEHIWSWGDAKRGRLELLGFLDMLAEAK